MYTHNMLAGMINLWDVLSTEVADLIVKAHHQSTNQEVVRLIKSAIHLTLRPIKRICVHLTSNIREAFWCSTPRQNTPTSKREPRH